MIITNFQRKQPKTGNNAEATHVATDATPNKALRSVSESGTPRPQKQIS